MGMSPYKMVYRKTCHLPLELEHKAYWAELNYDFKPAGEKRLFDISSLDEWRTQAYENAKLFKEKVKRWHDKRIQKREFNVGCWGYNYLCKPPRRGRVMQRRLIGEKPKTKHEDGDSVKGLKAHRRLKARCNKPPQ